MIERKDVARALVGNVAVALNAVASGDADRVAGASKQSAKGGAEHREATHSKSQVARL